MATLQERLQEVMDAKGWQYPDLVRVSGESRSVVSQWLGKSSKLIKSIGKVQAAERIERASGFAALWVAKGMGPKHAAPQAAQQMGGIADAVQLLVDAVAAMPTARWFSVRAQLDQVAGRPELRDEVVEELCALLAMATPEKRQRLQA